MSILLRATLIVAVACLVALPSTACAGFLGVQVKLDDGGKGIAVVDVLADSPAAKAGLKKDDVITHVNDVMVGELKGFIDTIKEAKSGETVKLKVLRDAKEVEIKATLGDSPGEEAR
jgi:S1-C subfamily serine protease